MLGSKLPTRAALFTLAVFPDTAPTDTECRLAPKASPLRIISRIGASVFPAVRRVSAPLALRESQFHHRTPAPHGIGFSLCAERDSSVPFLPYCRLGGAENPVGVGVGGGGDCAHAGGQLDIPAVALF